MKLHFRTRTLIFQLLLIVPLIKAATIPAWSNDQTMENDANCADSNALVLRHEHESKIYVAGGGCRPIFLKNSPETMLLGESGTVINEEFESIIMKPGKILVFKGKHPLKVKVNSFVVGLPGECTARIQLLPDGLLRFNNFVGKQTTLTLLQDNKIETLTAEAGEEFCITLDREYPDEKFILTMA